MLRIKIGIQLASLRLPLKQAIKRALPLPLDVMWAGDTPVITLTDLTIPGLGTCGARVVIHNDSYAGTWTHGNVRGHMFGVIKRAEETLDGTAPTETKPDN